MEIIYLLRNMIFIVLINMFDFTMLLILFKILSLFNLVGIAGIFMILSNHIL